MEDSLLKSVVNLLEERRLTIAIAESMTGGLLSQYLTSIDGSSRYFMGSIVAYSYFAKEKVLGVPHHLIEDFGAISKEVAEALAQNAAELLNTDIGVGITGNAGPDAQEGKPVGLVYVGLYYKGNTKVLEKFLSGSRSEIREQTVDFALNIILESLKEDHI